MSRKTETLNDVEKIDVKNTKLGDSREKKIAEINYARLSTGKNKSMGLHGIGFLLQSWMKFYSEPVRFLNCLCHLATV